MRQEEEKVQMYYSAPAESSAHIIVSKDKKILKKERIRGGKELVDLENGLGWKVSLCKFIHARPGKFCAGCCSLLFVMSVIAVVAFPFLKGETDISNPLDPANVAMDGIRLARDEFGVNFDTDDSFEISNLILTYVWDDKKEQEILNAKNLQTMCEFERVVFQQHNPDYEECDPLTAQEVCVTIDGTIFGRESLSIAALLYQRINGTFSYDDCFLLEENLVETAVQEFYTELKSSPENEVNLGFFVNSKDLSTMVRSFIQVATDKETKTLKALLEIEQNLFDFCGSSQTLFRSAYRETCTVGNIRLIFYNDPLVLEEITRLLTGAGIWVVLSIVFVTLWTIFYTNSKFLTLCFMCYTFAIVTSSLFIYKAILQIQYFDFLQILTIFLIIGINADANFVVLDAWKETKETFSDIDVDPKVLELRRFIYMHERATSTIFNTSLTTFCAFLVTSITSLMSISTFGIFSAICVMMIYFLSLTITPATILIYHRKWEDIDDKSKKNSRWDKLIERNYIPFLIANYKPILAITVCLGVLGLAGSTQITELTGQENFFPTDHMIQEFVNIGTFVGGSDDEFARLTFSFGIKGVKRDLFSRYSGDVDEYKESAVYNEDFVLDLGTINGIVSTCNDVLLEKCRGEICNGVSFLVTPEDGEYSHKCPLKNFSSFHFDTFNSSLLETDDDYVGDLELEVLVDRLSEFLSLEENAEFLDSFGLDREKQKVRFVTTEFRIVASPFQPGPQVRPTKEQLNDFVSEKEKEYGLRSMKFASVIFVEEASTRALLELATRGLIITIAVELCVGNIWSCNNYVYYSFGIISVPLGYEFGISETITTIMVVGLSIDYALHLLMHYKHAGEEEGIEERKGRVIFSARTIAKTVIAGGLTTLGAGIFLLFPQFMFFSKIGVFLCLTITLSLLFSLFFLMSLLLLLGPEGEKYNLEGFYKRLKSNTQD
eukprot:snap_masked-scaffold_51-processed-gene-1.53-mRNA-1 protein AED:1.00 eAED:1.00 QI:0/0/0/0/1/1/3/0/945